MMTANRPYTETRTLTQNDFDRFARLTGDANPIHVDPDFAARTRFGGTVSHGMFLYALVSAALSRYLPGAIELEQSLMFPAPTPADETVTVTLEVIEKGEATTRVRTVVTRSDGEVVCVGEALLGRASVLPMVHPVPGLAIGQSASITRTFTETEIDDYLSLSGDAGHALGTPPRKVPGVLLGGLFSQLLGMHLPGPGTNYLKQSLHFISPIHTGEEITASVEIVRIRPEKHLVNLRTICRTADRVVCEGEALVLVLDVVQAG